jgi:hypothetical protein
MKRFSKTIKKISKTIKRFSNTGMNDAASAAFALAQQGRSRYALGASANLRGSSFQVNYFKIKTI